MDGADIHSPSPIPHHPFPDPHSPFPITHSPFSPIPRFSPSTIHHPPSTLSSVLRTPSQQVEVGGGEVPFGGGGEAVAEGAVLRSAEAPEEAPTRLESFGSLAVKFGKEGFMEGADIHGKLTVVGERTEALGGLGL